MEQRRHQFLGFIVILLIVGFLNYFRKISNGHKFTRSGKILYLSTMICFVVGIMFLLYFTELNNIISFGIGLLVATSSEYIAKLYVQIGENFNPIVVKVLKKISGIDLSDELLTEEDKEKQSSRDKSKNDKSVKDKSVNNKSEKDK